MDKAIALKRAKLRSRILEMNGVPFHGPTPTPYAAVGEAPGKKEVEAGRPFVGPAGKLLRGLMKQADLDPDQFFWTNTVPYLPDHITPTAQEISRHRPLLDRQLLLASSRFVLLVGGVALSAFRSDYSITVGRGKPFWRAVGAGVIYFPIFHPAAALRDQAKVAYIRDDLKQFKAITVLGEAFGELWPETCMRCKKDVEVYDENGLAYCEEHTPAAGAFTSEYQFKQEASHA